VKVLRNEVRVSFVTGWPGELRNFLRTEPLFAFEFSQ
jgi:hypothetical protein